MSNAPLKPKEAIKATASRYGIEVVGFLRLDSKVVIPTGEMTLLEGVRWADATVDLSGIQDPLEIMPTAKAMLILGKRLLDDRQDVYYHIARDYDVSVEMMALDVAAVKIMELLRKDGLEAEEYTSMYLKGWAALAGLGWIGRSSLFVSKDHGPRLRLRGILTDADLGEAAAVMSDDSCGPCTECAKACPMGAIDGCQIDRKKCGANPMNHRKISEKAYTYCTECTACCPVGLKKAPEHPHEGQAILKQQITP